MMSISIASFSMIGDGSQYWRDLFVVFHAFFATVSPVMQLTPNIFSCVRDIASYSLLVRLEATVMKFSWLFPSPIFHALFQLHAGFS